MAISTFAQSPIRTRIAYVGSLPDGVSGEFEARGFTVVLLDESLLQEPGALQQIDSVLFFQAESKPSKIYGDLEKYASTLLAHDCRIYVQHLPHLPGPRGNYRRLLVVNAIETQNLPAEAYSLNEAERATFTGKRTALDRPTYSPFVYVVPDSCDWREMANVIRNNPAGAAPNIATKVELIAGGEDDRSRTTEGRLLLQRAFHDCKKVDLVPLSNGMSNASTYRVHAELQDNVIPTQWPYMYFVKLGERQDIAKEYNNYRESAIGHVPFHLGPRLKLDRCNLGHTLGILVSDYVVGAEALRDCARDGRAAAAVGNLFSTTIASWRSGARVDGRNLPDTLAEVLPDEVPGHRRDAMLRFGAMLKLEELRAKFSALDSSPVLMGVIHGDLHATNVLVRGGDAIIIDFEKIETDRPVLFDAASLEAGLFVDGFVGDWRSGEEVLKSVSGLYSMEALNGELLSCHPKDGSSWYFDCIRQIRLHAQSMEQGRHQYAWILACLLAKKACQSKILEEKIKIEGRLTREDLRAMAMVLAERIFESLSKEA